MKNKLIAGYLIFQFLFLPGFSLSADICFPEKDAKELLRTIQECEINQEILEKQEMLIENLKEQNSLLKEQNAKLSEIIELQKSNIQMLNEALIETQKQLEKERKKNSGLWAQLKLYLAFLLGFSFSLLPKP